MGTGKINLYLHDGILYSHQDAQVLCVAGYGRVSKMYEGEKKKDTEPCIITSPFEYLCGGVCVCVHNICKGRQKPLRIMAAFGERKQATERQVRGRYFIIYVLLYSLNLILYSQRIIKIKLSITPRRKTVNVFLGSQHKNTDFGKSGKDSTEQKTINRSLSWTHIEKLRVKVYKCNSYY